VPEAKITISGNIEDFTRLDNVYRSLKREAEKLLSGWKMDIAVSYVETQGEKLEEK